MVDEIEDVEGGCVREVVGAAKWVRRTVSGEAGSDKGGRQRTGAVLSWQLPFRYSLSAKHPDLEQAA